MEHSEYREDQMFEITEDMIMHKPVTYMQPSDIDNKRQEKYMLEHAHRV